MVASFENCKKLYELSGWVTDDFWQWVEAHQKYELNNGDSMNEQHPEYPAYGLGYMLRKLPDSTDIDADKWQEAFDTGVPDHWFLAREMNTMQHQWRIQYQIEESVLEPTVVEADTPEDAVCLLAIKLFEENILTKGAE